MFELDRSRRKHGGLSVFGLSEIGNNDTRFQHPIAPRFDAWVVEATGSHTSKGMERTAKVHVRIADLLVPSAPVAVGLARVVLEGEQFHIKDIHFVEKNEKQLSANVIVVITEGKRKKRNLLA